MWREGEGRGGEAAEELPWLPACLHGHHKAKRQKGKHPWKWRERRRYREQREREHYREKENQFSPPTHLPGYERKILSERDGEGGWWKQVVGRGQGAGKTIPFVILEPAKSSSSREEEEQSPREEVKQEGHGGGGSRHTGHNGEGSRPQGWVVAARGSCCCEKALFCCCEGEEAAAVFIIIFRPGFELIYACCHVCFTICLPALIKRQLPLSLYYHVNDALSPCTVSGLFQKSNAQTLHVYHVLFCF